MIVRSTADFVMKLFLAQPPASEPHLLTRMQQHLPAPSPQKLTGNTSKILKHYVGNRKNGHIFINMRTWKKLTLRHFETMIDKWARLLNIQKLQSIKPSGKEYHLIKLMGRDAGEMQHDLQWLLMCLQRQLGTVRRRRRGILRK